MPRQGYLEAALHIIGYLKLRHNSRLVFDPSYPNMDHSNFCECVWTDFCEVEAIPPNALLLKEKEVDLSMFVDINHAVDKWTRRSRTRLMIYVSMSLVNWYSEKSLHRNISVRHRICCHELGIETLHTIQYKLRILDVPIFGALYVPRDNMFVIHNTSKPE